MRGKTCQLQLEISPEEYKEEKEKALGNHFVYARVPPNLKWNDRRVRYLNCGYFHNKRVLDIGCNEGILSIPIAIKYQPELMEAIDIDARMVRQLNKNKEQFVSSNPRFQFTPDYIKDVATLPKFFRSQLDEISGKLVCELERQCEMIPEEMESKNIFPHNLTAKTQNVFSLHTKEAYHCILCMNLTKWIHLAYGDQGLKQLFNKINYLLEENGVLVLESQPWSSYRKKKNYCSSYQKNYSEILHRPERFIEFFKKKGFHHLETIQCSAQNQLKHDIWILQKRAFYSQRM